MTLVVCDLRQCLKWLAIVPICALLVFCPALANTSEISYGVEPDWVVDTPEPAEINPNSLAPIAYRYHDIQERLVEGIDETYTAQRFKIMTPEGLAAGNINISWNPAANTIAVHKLNIIRDDKVIDILKSNRFEIIRRENNLEQSMLDGQLTAVLQVPGLQIADEIEFHSTHGKLDPTIGDRSYGMIQFPVQGTNGTFRHRLAWPKNVTIKWKATDDLKGNAKKSGKGGNSILVHMLENPDSVILTEGAPDRFNIRRLIEYSDFKTWRQLSNTLAPVFHAASTLTDESPLKVEAKKIANATSDQKERAQLALRLVQNEIRYVYIGLDGGNYRPAHANETWSRRFGDCKAKTVLLLALLKELGISGEAMLVNISGDDGLNERLPTPLVFNHIVVRVRLAKQDYWLDGTRLGDDFLDAMPGPAYQWALPLRENAADLVNIPKIVPKLPQKIEVMEIDASAGFEADAKVKITTVFRGDEAFRMQRSLKALSVVDAERTLKSYWRNATDWVELENVSWQWKSAQAMLIMVADGTSEIDWEGNAKKGRVYYLPGAGFTPPAKLTRPPEQDQMAPWKQSFPRFRCWATTVRLPPSDDDWTWAYRASSVDEQLGGEDLYRVARLRDDVMRTIMSRRISLPELSAEQAKLMNDTVDDLDNRKSRVKQRRSFNSLSPDNSFATAGQRVFDQDIDWTSDNVPCQSPNS